MSKRRATAREKEMVAERANLCCEYCLSQLRYSPDSFSVEHILPRSGAGETQLDNLALSCQGCNNHKYNNTTAIDPVTGQTVMLFHPRRQHWREHFTWNEDFSLLLGLTPSGRATIAKLQLNREGVVNLRRALRSINKHPPH